MGGWFWLWNYLRGFPKVKDHSSFEFHSIKHYPSPQFEHFTRLSYSLSSAFLGLTFSSVFGFLSPFLFFGGNSLDWLCFLWKISFTHFVCFYLVWDSHNHLTCPSVGGNPWLVFHRRKTNRLNLVSKWHFSTSERIVERRPFPSSRVLTS